MLHDDTFVSERFPTMVFAFAQAILDPSKFVHISFSTFGLKGPFDSGGIRTHATEVTGA